MTKAMSGCMHLERDILYQDPNWPSDFYYDLKFIQGSRYVTSLATSAHENAAEGLAGVAA